jgi:hypothetical protein
MRDIGKPWVKTHPAPPDPLTADISPFAIFYTSDMQTIRIGFTNKTATEQQIEYVIVTFAAGPSAGAVFTWDTDFTVSDVASAGNAKLSAPPTGCTLSSVSHKSALVPGDTNHILTISNSDPSASFAVPVGGRVEIIVYGEIRSDGGEPCAIGWSVGGAEEVTSGTLDIYRSKKP